MALVAAYGFGAGSGSTIADDSGNGHTLTVVSGSYTASGHTGSGFKNDSNTATTGATGTVAAISGSTCTVMAWVTPSVLASGGTYLVAGSLDSGASTSFEIWTQRDDFGTSNILQGNARISGHGVVVVSGTALTVGTAAHVAMTFDGTTLKLWLNGSVVGSVSSPGTLSNTNTFYIAGHDQEGTAGIAMLDDVRYFDSDESANMSTWMTTSVGTSGGGSTINASASLLEQSTLSGATSRTAFGTSSLSEISSANATTSRTTFGAAALSESSTLSASNAVVAASVALSESSSLSATTTRTTFAAGSLSETSTTFSAPVTQAHPSSRMFEAATFTAEAHNSTVSVSLDMSEHATLEADFGIRTPAPANPGTPYIPPTPDNTYARNEWRAFVFNTRTGAYETDLPLANIPTYTRGINDEGGSGSVDVAIAGPDAFDPGLLDQYAENEDWRWCVGVSHNGVIIQAGPILTETYTDPATYVTLNFAGAWKLFTKRVVLNPAVDLSTPSDPMADLTYTNVTPYQLAKLLVRDNMISQGELPIDLPDDDPNVGSLTQTYYGYDLNLLSDALTNVSSMAGGPDIELRPYWVDPLNVRWSLRIGSPQLGLIGAPWAFDYGDRGSVALLDKSSDSSSTAVAYYAKGSGSQDAQVIGYASDGSTAADGVPLLVGVDSNHTDETSADNLNAYATADVTTYRLPIRTYTATIRLNGTDISGQPTGSPTLSQLQMGDTMSVHVENHFRIPDGDYTWRVLSVTNNDEQTCKLALQPTS